MPFQPGNKYGGRKEKPFRDALLMEIKAAGEEHKALRAIAKTLLQKADGGDMMAIKELADRVDGKVPQAVVGDDEHAPVGIKVIENIIVGSQADNEDGADIPAAIEGVTV